MAETDEKSFERKQDFKSQSNFSSTFSQNQFHWTFLQSSSSHHYFFSQIIEPIKQPHENCFKVAPRVPDCQRFCFSNFKMQSHWEQIIYFHCALMQLSRWMIALTFLLTIDFKPQSLITHSRYSNQLDSSAGQEESTEISNKKSHSR